MKTGDIMKKSLLALPFAAALLLTACGSNPAPTAGGPEANQGATSAAPTSAAPADRSAAIGGTVTYETGIAVTVKSLGFKPVGQYAVNAVEGQGAAFEITVKNGSDKELSASLMSFPKITYGETNTSTQLVIDSANNIGMQSFNTLLPGESQSVAVHAGIPAASAGVVRVEIAAPSFSDKPAIFKGAV